MAGFRGEHDSLGEIQVPQEALYGAQTQRALENFQISGQRFPRAFLRALGLIKAAAARANASLGLLDPKIAHAIEEAASEVALGRLDDQFPLDVYQTGSGTSTHMNANEVIAHVASAASGLAIHPNDHVNRGQSSNDVIPTAIHVSAYTETAGELLPALETLAEAIDARAASLDSVIKTGRTHLMDAMPIRMSQELSGWAAQVRDAGARIEATLPRLARLAIGGTAVGTGVNTHPEFGARVVGALAGATGLPFEISPNRFASLSAQDTAVELSGQLKACAVAVLKIANDLRWMNSGPVSGLAEIRLPALQPGSSIMPGKVNPVIPEAVAMVCARVMGNDVTITIAGQSGNFQLNVMLPVIAVTLLESISLLANGSRALAEKAIASFEVNAEHLEALVGRNAVLVTVLNPLIGYEAAAKLVKKAMTEERSIIEVAEEAGVDAEAIANLRDIKGMTGAG